MKDQQIADALTKVLTYADLRKHLADDEHRDPLPIYGARRWFTRRRMPVASLRETPLEKLQFLRECCTQQADGLGVLWPLEFTNNEEGD